MVSEIVSVREACRRLGRGKDTIEHALRAGTFPIGTAYKTAAGRYVYIIPRKAFERLMAGEISGTKECTNPW